MLIPSAIFTINNGKCKARTYLNTETGVVHKAVDNGEFAVIFKLGAELTQAFDMVERKRVVFGKDMETCIFKDLDECHRFLTDLDAAEGKKAESLRIWKKRVSYSGFDTEYTVMPNGDYLVAYEDSGLITNSLTKYDSQAVHVECRTGGNGHGHEAAKQALLTKWKSLQPRPPSVEELEWSLLFNSYLEAKTDDGYTLHSYGNGGCGVYRGGYRVSTGPHNTLFFSQFQPREQNFEYGKVQAILKLKEVRAIAQSRSA